MSNNEMVIAIPKTVYFKHALILRKFPEILAIEDAELRQTTKTVLDTYVHLSGIVVDDKTTAALLKDETVEYYLWHYHNVNWGSVSGMTELFDLMEEHDDRFAYLHIDDWSENAFSCRGDPCFFDLEMRHSIYVPPA